MRLNPEVLQMMYEEGVDPDAYIVSPRENLHTITTAGRLLLKVCKERGYENPRELFPVGITVPRGSWEMDNILFRNFGYSATDLENFAITSYKVGMTGQNLSGIGTDIETPPGVQYIPPERAENGRMSPGFLIGQTPRKEVVKGRKVLLLDEVCDSGWTLWMAQKVLYEVLEADEVFTVVQNTKPDENESGVFPNISADDTKNQWLVYPREPYELLGHKILEEDPDKVWQAEWAERIWVPDENGMDGTSSD